MPEPNNITSAREQFDLEEGFSSSDLKASYRCLAQIYHPDRFDSVDNWKVHKRAEMELKSLNTNYRLLQDWLAEGSRIETENKKRQEQRKAKRKAQRKEQQNSQGRANNNNDSKSKRKKSHSQASRKARAVEWQAANASQASTVGRDRPENREMVMGLLLKLGLMFAAAMILLGVVIFWESPLYQKLPHYTPPPPPSKDKLLPSKQKLPADKPKFDQTGVQQKEVPLVPMRDWVERDGYRFIAELVSIHLDGDSYYWGVFRRRTGEEKYLRINELSVEDAEIVRRDAIAKGIYKPAAESEAAE